MKKLILAIAIVIGLTSVTKAQNANPTVIALLTKASWCPVCKANGPRFEKDIMPMVMKNNKIKMVMNDLSDDHSKEMSKGMLEKAGIYQFSKDNPATGMLYFFNAKTKKLLSSVSLAESNKKIKEAYMDALSKS